MHANFAFGNVFGFKTFFKSSHWTSGWQVVFTPGISTQQEVEAWTLVI